MTLYLGNMANVIDNVIASVIDKLSVILLISLFMTSMTLNNKS